VSSGFLEASTGLADRVGRSGKRAPAQRQVERGDVGEPASARDCDLKELSLQPLRKAHEGVLPKPAGAYASSESR